MNSLIKLGYGVAGAVVGYFFSLFVSYETVIATVYKGTMLGCNVAN